MRVRGVLKLVLAVTTVISVCGGAEARQALWDAGYWGRIDGFVYDDEDRKEAKVKGKVEGEFGLDTTNSLYLDVMFDDQLTTVRLTGQYLDDSDRKSKVTDEPDDDDDMDLAYPLLFKLSAPEFKKPRIEPAFGVDFSDVNTIGKVKVNKSFQKIKVMNKVTFEGTVLDGDYAGQTIRGKIRLKIKGDRDDG